MTSQFRLATIVSAGLAAVVLSFATPADAGRGGSASRITNAVATGSVDAIIAEIERAERLPCDACVPVVMDLLDSDRYELREVAAWWFARRASLRVQLRTRSVADLAGTDGRLARNAADILGTFRHPNAIPALAAAVVRTDLSPEARAAAAQALGTIGHRNGSAAIAAAMGDSDATVRFAAVTAWSKVRKQVNAAPAVALVGDADVSVRATAVAVIGGLRDGAGRASLEAAVIADSDAGVRRNAAWALGQIGDPASRTALTNATTDSSSLVRSTARAALYALR